MDQVLASGDAQGSGNGSLFTVDLLSIVSFVGSTLIGDLDYSQLETMINQAAQNAEAGVPEGGLVELDITGWYNPITGADYSQSVADQINAYWQQGQFVVDGEPMQAWPGNSQVAWGSQDLGIADTLIIQYIKGFAWLIAILVVIALAAVALVVYEYYNNTAWKIGTSCPSDQYWTGSACAYKSSSTTTQTCNSGYHWTGTTCQKNPTWFSQLPLWEQIAFIGGGALVLTLGLVFAEQYALAGAGASKTAINVGGGY